MDEMLYNAVQNNNITKTEQLLKKGGDVNYHGSPRPYTLLTKAVHSNNIQLCELLIEHGADLNKRDEEYCPVHEACRYNRVNILSILISRGADINAKSRNGNTALHIAAKKSHFETVEYLLGVSSLNTQVVNNNGKTALVEVRDERVKTLFRESLEKHLLPSDWAEEDQISKETEVLKKYREEYEKDKLNFDKSWKKSNEQLEKVNGLKLNKIEESMGKNQEEISKLDVEIGILAKKMGELKSQKADVENKQIKLAEEKRTLKRNQKEEISSKMSFTYDKRSFECCVCLSIPYAPKKVLSCTNGHCVFDVCKQTLQVCPICRVDLSNAVRNLAVERLLAESEPV